MCFTWVTSYSEWPSFSLCKTAMTIVSSQAPTSLIQLDSLTLQLFIIGMLNQGDSMPQGTLGVLFVQSLSHVRLFVTPSWTAAGQASLSSMPGSLLKLMTIELVMSFNHIILSPPCPLAFNLSQHQGLFQWVGSSHQVAKVLELQLQHQSFQWIYRVDFPPWGHFLFFTTGGSSYWHLVDRG